MSIRRTPSVRSAALEKGESESRPVLGIVDDDRSVRRALHRVLQSAGYTVQTFESAPDVLDWLSRGQPACLLVDAHLDGRMNGLELHERLAADGVGIPVIFITAHDDAPTRERIERSGAAGYLWKPLDEVTLLDAIRRAIGGDEDEPGRSDP